MLTPQIKAAIAAFCRETPHQEVCGIISADGAVLQCQNVAADPAQDFLLETDFWETHQDSALAIWHSHWDETQPCLLTHADIEQGRFFKLPYILYHTACDRWDYWEPEHIHPYPLKAEGDPAYLDYYKGWPFDWGRSDCASLLRGYYKGVLGIAIPDYPRPTDQDYYLKPDSAQQYLDLFRNPANGFRSVSDGPKLHDVILMRFRSAYPHHVAVMVDCDRMGMLHLIEPGTVSTVVTYGGHWLRATDSVWRHSSLMQN